MSAKRYPNLPNIHNCTGCMSCGDSCPQKCISYPDGKDGHWHAVVDTSKCVQCLRCERACPVLKRKKPLSSSSQPYASWSFDGRLRSISSSGGTFAQIARHFIMGGGYVVGAAIDGVKVKHIVINKQEDLHLLQGSKYIQSDTHGIFARVKQLLSEGNKVLFSGVGCQVAAIYNYLPQRLWENLFTIDLICHGVPSPLDLKRYLDMHDTTIVEIKSFRDKSWKAGYAMTCVDKNGKVIRDEDNYFFAAFNNNKSLRWSCYTCKFKTGLHRCSDITIGDFWGAVKFKEELKNGLSLSITHSSKGKQLIAESGLKYEEVDWDECLFRNRDYFYGNNLFRFNPIRWLYPRLIHKGSDKLVCQAIGSMHLREKKKHFLLFLDAIFQHFNYSVSNKMLKKQLWQIKKR